MKLKITFDEITPRPDNGNYTLYHYGVANINKEAETGGIFDCDFTLCEMHDDNSDSSTYEITWVDYVPDEYVELEKMILSTYEKKAN